jgi:hypothetical protein
MHGVDIMSLNSSVFSCNMHLNIICTKVTVKKGKHKNSINCLGKEKCLERKTEHICLHEKYILFRIIIQFYFPQLMNTLHTKKMEIIFIISIYTEVIPIWISKSVIDICEFPLHSRIRRYLVKMVSITFYLLN